MSLCAIRLYRTRHDVNKRRTFKTSMLLCESHVVKTPPFAESVTEGDTSIPIHAPVGGVIEAILAQDGDKVIAEQELCRITISDLVLHVVIGLYDKRVKMNRMRQRIAQRLKDAQNTCAMLTTFNDIDMSNVMDLRTKYKDVFLKKHNVKLGFMSAFIKASAAALTGQPIVNAVIDDLEIVYRNYIDISVAVATPKGLVVPVLRDVGNMNYSELFMCFSVQGLVVPVLRDVGNMNYSEIEKGLNELGEKARTGSLAIEDMDGGTFTISNGGVFGSLLGTPIINPPQSAILGMHGIFDRPVAINGKVEIRPMMYVALTYDHRLIDGREAATFLRKIKSNVEDPRVLLLDL
ncbi:hypothetical protein LSH36_204g06003 [Paralvinella palmiformis]|uniref:Dihydrolipoyllysine-residue succinyltransferase component of 2-oxoglutarate dehydrogenase complex, mitochondrial n=1 Tax=Paralvinella palmiformis TaxID=53620 RepID=A0AAD9JP55_9ANNE|nr:hypothetical protein LSH36_204g06003 [Paralvinella palmiformis]